MKLTRPRVIIIAGAILNISVPIWHELLNSELSKINGNWKIAIFVALTILIIEAIGLLVFAHKPKQPNKPNGK